MTTKMTKTKPAPTALSLTPGRSGGDSFQIIPLAQLSPSPDNPRREVGDVTELAASIKAAGLLEPLVVTASRAGYQVVIGHRRLVALVLAGITEAPCIVRTFSDDQARVEAMLIENLQREDLTPLEEGEAYRRLLGTGLSQHELGPRIGRSQSHISKRLALLKLPEPARQALDSGSITLEDASHLVQLTEIGAADRTVQEVLASHDIGGHVERLVRRHEWAQQRQQLEAQAKAAGWKIVQTPDGYSTKGPQLVERLYERQVPKQHGEEPCHAVCISGTRLQDVCTDPNKHPLKPGYRAGQTTQDVARLALDRERKASNKARGAFMEALLRDDIALGTLFTHFARTILSEGGPNPTKIACELLGLEVAKTATSWGGTTQDYSGVLAAYAAAKPRQLTQAALALSFGLAEEGLRSFGGGWRQLPHHLGFLQERGYELTPQEQKLLTDRQQHEADDAAMDDAAMDDGDEDALCRFCGEPGCAETCSTALVATATDSSDA